MTLSINENILNNYNSYNYNLSLYMVTKQDFNRVVEHYNLNTTHQLKFQKKVMIAQTGSTSLNFNSFTISSYPSDTEGAYFNTMTLNIEEVLGFNLIESIFVASKICGWTDALSGPLMILELSFDGINFVNNQEVVSRGVHYQSFPIRITNISTNIEEGKVFYTVEAVLNYYSDSDDFSTIPESMKIDNVINFDDFIKKFGTALNNAIKKDKTTNYNFNNIHKFVVDPSLQNIKLSTINSVRNDISDITITSKPNNGFSFQFNPKLSIPKAIESVLSISDQIQKMLVGKNGVGESVYIEPITKLTDFNDKLGKYNVEITWYIKPRKVLVPLKHNDAINDTQYLNNIVSAGALSRSYNWFYTGLNENVISANIDYQNIYYYKLAKYDDLFINRSNNSSVIQGQIITPDTILKTQKVELDKEINKYLPKPVQDSQGNDVYYVDDIDQTKFDQFFNYYNQFQPENSSTTPSQGTKTQSALSKQFSHNLTLNNARNINKYTMLTMELVIRGDPYWLTPYHTFYTGSNSISNSTFNLIAFFMGYPNTSQIQGKRTDSYFSGLYMITAVESKFENGYFTQTLKASRLPNVKSYLLQQIINKG